MLLVDENELTPSRLLDIACTGENKCRRGSAAKEMTAPPSFALGVEFFDVPTLGPVSSTIARASKTTSDLETICDSNVAHYIALHHLYGFSVL